jgi:peptidoglycan/xylan/chitin deacetylase (PgdA/CDA1 family)
MKEINILLTMDCEPTLATTHAQATGPRDWAHGERAVRGYFNIGKRYGFPASYFVHPETVLGQPDVFADLETQGACLGLHMHPWKYSMWRYEQKRFLANYGGMSADEQRACLAESSALWRQAMGYQPLYFRPGSFSANDDVFRVLAETGFRGGSCSVPGRVWPDVETVWSGAEPDPHRANACFRQVRGNLEFANIPVSVDFSSAISGAKGRTMHSDLRPDTDWPGKHGISYQTIANNILAQTVARAPKIPVIVIISHNHYEYSDESNAVTKRLIASLDAVVAACKAANIKPVGTTIAKVVDDVLADPLVPEPFVCPESAYSVNAKP